MRCIERSRNNQIFRNYSALKTNFEKFHNCRFFPVSRSRIGVRDDPVSSTGQAVFSPGLPLAFARAGSRENGGQAVIPAQSLSLAKSLPSRSRGQGRESTKKASISRWIPAGAEPVLAKARDGVVKLFNRRFGNFLVFYLTSIFFMLSYSNKSVLLKN